MEKMLDERYKIDELADAAGGYFAMPSADELAYTELLFDVCDQFGTITTEKSLKGSSHRRKSFSSSTCRNGGCIKKHD